MAEPRRIVVVAQRVEGHAEHSEVKTRTAVFDDTATLRDVFDWLRLKSADHIAKAVGQPRWWDARLSLHEDEATREQRPA